MVRERSLDRPSTAIRSVALKQRTREEKVQQYEGKERKQVATVKMCSSGVCVCVFQSLYLPCEGRRELIFSAFIVAPFN